MAKRHRDRTPMGDQQPGPEAPTGEKGELIDVSPPAIVPETTPKVDHAANDTGIGKPIPVRLTQDIALGAGTRKRGELLGYIQVSYGITPVEIINAIRNPHVCGLL